MKDRSDLPAAYAKVVVDTNVLISTLLIPGSVPFALVDLLLARGALVFSKATFAEFETRIWKPKFDRYLSIELRQRLLRDFDATASWVDVSADLEATTWSRDPDDDQLIRAALAAGATRLITGDADLLVLHPLDTLHILTPRAALDEIGMQQVS
jgi:uncharacterized protein